MLLQQCYVANSKRFAANPLKKGKDARNEMNKFFTFVREVLHDNYQSRNLIGPYHILGISPRNSTSFTRPFLAGRHMQAGQKTRVVPGIKLLNAKTEG